MKFSRTHKYLYENVGAHSKNERENRENGKSSFFVNSVYAHSVIKNNFITYFKA
jgi:hypothetical protein